jgi:hypothetical protein
MSPETLQPLFAARRPMDKIVVRDARHDEAELIVQMIRHMVREMAS